MISGVYSGVTTVELDTLAAETAASMTTKHPDYAILAARIAVSNLHKETEKVFSGEPVTLTLPVLLPSLSLVSHVHLLSSLSLLHLSPSLPLPYTPLVVMKNLYEYRNPHNGRHSPMVSKELLDIVTENADVSNDW